MAADDHEDRGPAGPAHATRPPGAPHRIRAWVGAAAALAAIGLGTAALLRPAPESSSGVRSLQAITVASAPTTVLPLSDAEILALLDRSPDFGPLAEPHRRGACLAGLGYPGSVRVLGARPIEVNGHPAVLLVLPGDRTGTVAALAVSPGCTAADTGLLVDTVVQVPERP